MWLDKQVDRVKDQGSQIRAGIGTSRKMRGMDGSHSRHGRGTIMP
jgi:hypothetical protein